MKQFSVVHELTLVREIMAMIERYHTALKITPRLDAIRDTMLSAAALLHIEDAGVENARAHPKLLEETFLDKARERLAKVREISLAESGDLEQ